MRKIYPSDITREQFAVIEADLSAAKKTTHPRVYALYDLFCAVQYVLKQGCTWRALPHDFPPWQNVYYHFRVWKRPGEDGETLLDKVLRKLVGAYREKNGRDRHTTMLIVDSRSVKNADTAEQKGYDAGKKLQASSCTSALTRRDFSTPCS
jgi:transposase